MTINVKKRSNKTEPFMVSKIKQVISWACENTSVNPLALESKFDDFVADGISTSYIHDNLIHHAQSLASPTDPDWVTVAGRLQTMKLWKETGAYDLEFADYIQKMKSTGHYTHPGIDAYSLSDIEELGKEICQERDLSHSYGSVITAIKKYLSPGECIQQMFMVNSMIMASVEEPANRVLRAKQFYDKLSNRKISLATPWLSNLRDNGNISSCFIISVDDSIDSITKNWRNAAFISKLGGGLGIDLSRIRAKGATIGKIKHASGGVCGWAKTFNEIAVNVDQCFHADTLVLTHNGNKKISEIDIEKDFVMTHSGTFSSVDKILKKASKKLKSRKIVSTAGEVIATESHPVLVISGNINNRTDEEIIQSLKTGNDLFCQWKNVADLEAGDKVLTVLWEKKEVIATVDAQPIVIKYPDLVEINDINNEKLVFDFNSVSINTITDIENDVETTKNVYDLVMKGANASYVVPSLGIVHNGGKRAGAFTVSVPVWHRDIEDFLEVQSETGDQRKKAHDIFPQIAVHDLYMEAVKANDDWYTFCPHEVKAVLGLELYGCSNQEFESRYQLAVDAVKQKKLSNFGKYNAKDFMKKIMRTQFETGLPYLFFVDTANRTNPNKHEGHIPCGNLCQESFSNVVPDQYAHTCNLASLVAGRMTSIDEIIQTARIATRMLDNGIALTSSPVEISSAHNNRYRTIGVGIQGMHDYLALNFTNYNDITSISRLAEAIEYGCILESVELAKERGTYPAFEGSMWQTGERVSSFKTNTVNNFDWDSIQELINQHGIRNSQLTSPAPNCQAGDNPVLVYNGLQDVEQTTLYNIMRNFDIDYQRVEAEGIPMWLNLSNPITVPTFEGNAFVHRIWYNGLSEQVYRLTFSDNTVYTYTGNHKLLLTQEDDSESWVECNQIRVGDKLLSRKHNNVLTVTDIQVDTNVHTYDFEVKDKHHYLMENGIVSHNTSTSIFMDAAAGVMPVYSAFFREDNSTGKFPVASMHLSLNPLSYSKTFGMHDQVRLTQAVGAAQKFIDTGISAEYLFDQNLPNFSAKMLYDTIIAAWENDTKSVYYIRSIKRGSTIDDLLGIKDEGCVGCAG